MKRSPTSRMVAQILWVALLLIATSIGCATRGFVRNEVTALRQDMTAKTERLEQETAEVRNSAEQALRRAELAFGSAEESRLLALGHVGYREVSRQSVAFAFDTATLDDDARTILDEVADLIRVRPDIVIDVYGFTDTAGSASYNEILGQRRADTVVRYLAGRTPGPVGRYAAISFGEARPSAGVKDVVDSGAQQRRVVVSLFERVAPEEMNEAPPDEGTAEFN